MVHKDFMKKLRDQRPHPNFQCPPISEEEKTALITIGTYAFDQLLQTAQLVRLSDVVVKKSIKLLKKTKSLLTSTTTYLQGNTIDDVYAYFLETARDHYSYCYKMNCNDTELLYELQSPWKNGQTAFVALRWFTVSSSLPFIKDRDFVVLEFVDQFMDSKTGKRGWARCLHSISHTACPSLYESHGFVRNELMHSGYLMYETGEELKLQGIMVMELYKPLIYRFLPSFVVQKMLKKRSIFFTKMQQIFAMQKQNAVRLHGSFSTPFYDHKSMAIDTVNPYHYKRRYTTHESKLAQYNSLPSRTMTHHIQQEQPEDDRCFFCEDVLDSSIFRVATDSFHDVMCTKCSTILGYSSRSLPSAFQFHTDSTAQSPMIPSLSRSKSIASSAGTVSTTYSAHSVREFKPCDLSYLNQFKLA